MPIAAVIHIEAAVVSLENSPGRVKGLAGTT